MTAAAATTAFRGRSGIDPKVATSLCRHSTAAGSAEASVATVAIIQVRTIGVDAQWHLSAVLVAQEWVEPLRAEPNKVHFVVNAQAAHTCNRWASAVEDDVIELLFRP